RPPPHRTHRTAVPRRTARPRPPHRHRLVPCRRHHRRLPPGLYRARHPRQEQGPRRCGRPLPRPPPHHRPRPSLADSLGPPAHATRRPRGRGRRPAPQPHARARPAEVPLRSHLGHHRLGRPTPAVAHPGPTAAR